MTTIPGSYREPKGMKVGEVPDDELIEVSVALKRGSGAGGLLELFNFANANGLRAVGVPHVGPIKIEGRADRLRQAFGVELGRFVHLGHEYRARTGAIQVPDELAPSIEAVLGIDNRPIAKPHFRPHANPSSSYTPPQVAKAYGFPTDVTGAGETIAIIELGGGFKPADITTYFKGLGIKEPNVVTVLVDKAKNEPSNANSADGEVLLDIEVAASVAPGARIVVYFAPNTDAGFLDALTTAIHDTVNKPSVISISWGGPEADWTAQAMTAMDSAAAEAAALGITICVASGDNGSDDGVGDGKNHVDFPASSPNVLACGGTSLRASGVTIESETVWNDGESGGASGGGYSAQFAKPAWQKSSTAGRGVPDVAGNADPDTGYQVLVDGERMVIGGTSAVAPLWAGLIALLNQKFGKPLGFLNPKLYAGQGAPPSGVALRDIVQGNNGAFSAAPGWDPCTGLGSPNGMNLEKAL